MSKEPKEKSSRFFRKKSSKESQLTRQERFDSWVDALPEFDVALKTWKFWRDSILIFFIGSFVGHVFEVIIWLAMVSSNPAWQLPLIPIIAEPFGFGAMLIMWFVYPLVKKHKLGAVGSYIFGALLATTVEFVCAAVITGVLGHNPFWDYSGTTYFNLFGFVCLHNSLLFGVGALYFIYSLYPWLAKWISRLGNKTVNIITVILLLVYGASLVCYALFGFRLIL